MPAKNEPTPEEFRSPRYWPTWAGIGLLWLSARMPYPVQLGIGRSIGWLMYLFGRDRRHITAVNLRLCFPELSPEHRSQLVCKTFMSNGIGLIETAQAWFRGPEALRDRVELQGRENLDKALEQGKGAILLGAHFTTLDLGGALLSLYQDIDVMYRRHKNPLFDAVMKRGREKLYGAAFERKEVRGVLRSLKKNRAVWYAPDQDYGAKHSVFAPLFGISAATITGTTRFAQMSGAPVVPFSHFRKEDGSGYILRIHPALENFPTGDEVEDATRVNRWLEQEIRTHPDQYMWLHRRFKTRPPGELRPYRQNIVKKIRSDRYHALRETPGRVLVGDRELPKVILSDDGRIIKFFRQRKLISSNRLFPQSEAFVRNSIGLQALGIAAVKCDKVYRCTDESVDVIMYPALPGDELRDLVEAGRTELMERMPAYLGRLHDHGVMFRAIHLGNVLVQPDDSFALIDISDLDLKGGPLHAFRRARNILHLLNSKDDRAVIDAYGPERFTREYIDACGITGFGADIITRYVKSHLER